MKRFHRLANLATPLLFVAAWIASVPGAFGQGDDDWRLEVSIRKAIREHAQLTRYNPGVTVRGGSASLFGTMPTKSAHEELIRTVGTVRGVREVESRIRIVPPADKLPDQIADAVRFGKPIPGFDSPPIREDATAIVRDRPRGQTPGETTSTRIAMKPNTSKSIDLDEYLKRTTRNDLRYRQVTWTQLDGVVKLGGKVRYMQDAWDLADQLADLPGVRRVLLEGIGTK